MRLTETSFSIKKGKIKCYCMIENELAAYYLLVSSFTCHAVATVEITANSTVDSAVGIAVTSCVHITYKQNISCKCSVTIWVVVIYRCNKLCKSQK